MLYCHCNGKKPWPASLSNFQMGSRQELMFLTEKMHSLVWTSCLHVVWNNSVEEEKLFLNKFAHFSFNQESISYNIMDIEFPCLVDLEFPCLSQWSQTHGLIHLNCLTNIICVRSNVLWCTGTFVIQFLCSGKMRDGCTPFTCIPFVSACMGLGTMAAREVPG